MLDIAVSYNRYRFLGKEFLTWLWYELETNANRAGSIDPEIASVEIGDRMVLENRGPAGLEVVTIKGDDPGLEEGITALKKGALVSELTLLFKAAEHQWRLSLKGESLHITGLKVPKTGPVETEADMDGAVLEKVFLVQRAVRLIEGLFSRFIRIRISDRWRTDTVPAMQKWIGT